MSSFDSRWEDRVLGDRYQIETLLGRGGMSSVYRAHDPNLQRKVAIKIIHPHLTDNPEFVKRFEQEAAAVAQLRHNNIVQVHDFNHDDSTYYMVLEFIPGESLGQKLRGLNSVGIHLPLNDTIRILSTVCEAVDYAHQRRMIHRDLKPANIMINLLGEPILMDFGIAKILGAQSHTATGAAMGTAAYMSPEQVRGEKTDHRADIYALGIVLYEMLRGETPYQGDSTFQIMLKHVNEPVPDIRVLDSNIPNAVANILERALAKSPNERYQSAAEMAIALHTVGMQLQGSVTDTLAARHVDRLSTMWQQAHDYFEVRKFPECIDKLDDLKHADSDYQSQKAAELRLKALDALHERAVRFYQDGKFEEALSTIDAFQRRSPDDIEANNLESLVKHGLENQGTLKRIQTLYDDAALLLERRKYEEAIEKWESIKRQKGDLQFEDRLEIVKRAKEGMCTSYYNEALRAVADGEPEKANILLGQIQAINPNFPDSQNVKHTIGRLIMVRKQKALALRIGTIIIVALVLLGGLFLLQRVFSQNGAAGDDTTEGIEQTAVFEEAPPVVITDTAETTVPTITSIVTNTVTDAVEKTAVFTPQPTEEATSTSTSEPTATETAVSTQTATPSPADDLDTAVVIQSASIFAAPSGNATERAILDIGENVRVLGRSRFGNWLYVANDNSIGGFVYGEFLQWPGVINDLPIFEPEESVPTPPTPIENITGLELDMFPIGGTERCEENMWYVSLYLEGRGGNGVYDYYWGGQLIATNQSGSITIELSSPGGSIIADGQVQSGDGQSVIRELFIPTPSCFGG